MALWWLCISIIGETRKFDFLSQIWPWRLRLIAPQNNRDLNQGILHLWSKFGDLAWMSDELWCGQAQNGVNFDFNLHLTLKVKVDWPQNNRDLNQGVLHLWSKFVDPRLNRSPFIARICKWLIHTQTQAMTITKGQNWPWVKKDIKVGSQNFGYQIWFCTKLLKLCSRNHAIYRWMDRRTRVYSHHNEWMNEWMHEWMDGLTNREGH